MRIRIVALIIPLCFIGILRSAPSVAAGVTVDQGSPSVHSRLGSESAAKAHVYAYDVMPSVATGHECCARAEASLLPRSVRPITDASSWLRGTPAGRVTTRSELVATNTARVVTTGQEHHVISRRIASALDDHPTLAGQYTPRDPRFVTQAVDDAAHRGYQTWHRQLDAEVVDWLARNPNATTSTFEQFLHQRYGQADLLARFPNGF